MYVFSRDKKRCAIFKEYEVIIGFVRKQKEDLEEIRVNILGHSDVYGNYERAVEVYNRTVKEYEDKFSDKKRMIFYINGEEFADYDIVDGEEQLRHLENSITEDFNCFKFD